MIRKLPDQVSLPESVSRLQVSHLLIIFKVSRQTLCNWRKDDKCPFPNSFRSGGQHFIMMDDLIAWLAARDVKIRRL